MVGPLFAQYLMGDRGDDVFEDVGKMGGYGHRVRVGFVEICYSGPFGGEFVFHLFSKGHGCVRVKG